MKGGAYFTILIERLVPVQLTSPSGQASPRGTPCPRSRDGLPDRDDVPDMYASIGPGVSACTHLRWVPGSFLGPAQALPT